MIGPLLLTLAAAAAPTPGCAAVRAALPQAGMCVEQPGGIALARDEAAARTMLDQARAGETRFLAAFGRPPARYAIFEFDDPATVAPTNKALAALGFQVTLPIPSPARTERMMADALRRVQAAAPAGAAPARIARSGGAPGSGEPRRANMVPHELSHKWYTLAFWPAAPATTGTGTPPPIRRYGSPAPDWLDEAAAMLAEDEQGTRDYHQQIADGRGADAQRAATIPPELPLATLTTMVHPSLADLPPAGAESAPVMIRMSKPSLFYPETRVFADYLIERSGEPRILAAISQGLRGGATFDAWLASDGARHRLPVSLAAMQADWDGWMDRRFGRAPDAP